MHRTALTSTAHSGVGGGLIPINMFRSKQEEIRSLVSDLDFMKTQKHLINNDHIHKVHHEFDSETNELQKCIGFYEH